MNLYLLSQSVDNDWDTFDSVVVCAASEDEARRIHPYGHCIDDPTVPSYIQYGWAPMDKVSVKLIGTASPDILKGVVLASFNGG